MCKKEFEYKGIKHCSFVVGNYLHNKQAMAITILDAEGETVEVATVNMPDYLYSPDTATLRNYSYTSGITKFLKKLGIIEEIYSTRKCNQYAQDSETIDYCQINTKKLKEYSSKFDYEWSM